jgi:hypothetical protein
MKPQASKLVLLLALATPALASVVDVTTEELARVHCGALIDAYFGVWNYGQNNPDVSPYPTTVGVQILGQVSSWFPEAVAVPDTTASYFPGLVFEGWLESLDGTITVPLFDPNASRLGLPVGTVVATPGTYQAGGQSVDVAVLAATAYMSEEMSELLFGSNVGNYDNAARIHLRNVGLAFIAGIGPGYTVQQSVLEPGVSGAGGTQTAGLTGHVLVSNPEPATWLLVVGALAVVGWRVTRSRSGSPSA